MTTSSFINKKTIVVDVKQFEKEGMQSFNDYVLSSMQDQLNDQQNMDFVQCIFEYGSHKQSIKGKQNCIDFYKLKAFHIYDTSKELKISYLFKLEDSETASKNELNNELMRTRFEESVEEFQKDLKKPTSVFNFIENKYDLSGIPKGISIRDLSLNEFAEDYLSGRKLCSLSAQKAKYVVSCDVDEEIHYSFATCYSKANKIPLTEVKWIDTMIHSLNKKLSVISTDQHEDFLVTIHKYCSKTFDFDEEISNEYNSYLLDKVGFQVDEL